MFSDEILYYLNLKRFCHKVDIPPRKKRFFPLFLEKFYSFDKQRQRFDTSALNASDFEISGLCSVCLDILIQFMFAFQAPNGFNGHLLFSFRHF